MIWLTNNPFKPNFLGKPPLENKVYTNVVDSRAASLLGQIKQCYWKGRWDIRGSMVQWKDLESGYIWLCPILTVSTETTRK